MPTCSRCGFKKSDSDGWIMVHKNIGKPIVACSLVCAYKYQSKNPSKTFLDTFNQSIANSAKQSRTRVLWLVEHGYAENAKVQLEGHIS